MPGASGSRRQALRAGLSVEDAALATEISQGVSRRRNLIDDSLKRFVHMASLKPRVKTVLRIGAYQLMFLDRIPDYAAVDATVDLARICRAQPGLVNAVLRKVAREPRPADASSAPRGGIERLATELSIPRWLAERWIRNYGEARAEEYAVSASETPPLHLATNTSLVTDAELSERLRGEGVECEGTELDGLLRVERGNPLRTRAFDEGLFYITGPSSFAVGEIASTCCAAAPALDCCAAPGGKLIRLALAGAKPLVGNDLTAHKIALVKENLDRMKLRGAGLVVSDFTKQLPFRALFGLVLLDAPCSGLGTIAKSPEIRWNRTEADVKRLARMQSEMLRSAFGLLRPGGTLVYSVCSLEPEEGERVVRGFLARRKDASIADCVHPRVKPDSDGFYRFFPRSGMHDGFFAAVLRRTKTI